LAELRLTRRAKENLRDLPTTVQDAVMETLERIAVDPDAEGRELVGRLRGLWSARIGNYDVLYTIERSDAIVRAIRHRAVAYGPRPPRGRG
jgi:mRNA interferase RelE/StbE